MRRRRQNRGTWFPILGINATGGETGDVVGYDVRNLAALTDFGPNVLAIPVIPDTGLDPNDPSRQGDATLRDYVEGQTCIIERIVGKIQWQVQQFDPSPNTTPELVICCTAFAVLPVDNDETTPAIASTEWDPLVAANYDKPYLWRRTWVLANNAAEPDLATGPFNAPASNAFFASRDDGPHIDTKGTKRAIRRNERIFMIHSVRGIYYPNDSPTVAGNTVVVADLRCLGRMVRSKNKSLFT